jgi:hypothetical protein
VTVGVAAGGDAEQAAWLAVVPTAIVTVVAIVLLGPPLAALALPTRSLSYWPELRAQGLVRPEGTEQARYAIALAAPLVLVALTWLLLERRRRHPLARAATLVRAVQWAGLAAVAGCFVAQWTYVVHESGRPAVVVHYFSAGTLVVGAAVAGAIATAARAAGARSAWTAWTRESARRRAVAWALAAAAVAIAVLPALQTDGGILAGNNFIVYHTQFPFDETAAVLDGRSPLGDFAAQYASLWPYALAGGMRLLGASLAVFTLELAALTAVTMLALFDLLRRVARSSLAALALFLPLLATGSFRLAGSGADRFSPVSYYGTLPLRYAGPFLLAWLVARHLDGARPRRAWPLFLAAGLSVINNVDFGLAALAATGLALATAGAREAGTLCALGREAAAGLAGALALVALLLLARTGAAPHFSLLVRYAGIFAGGFGMTPIRPIVGVSTLLLLTYVAAIGVAAVRAIGDSADRLLTGLLMWSGVFGLGAGAYYVGESNPERLILQFPAWALAVTLLAVVVVRRLAGRAGGRAAPSELMCLFALGLLACTLAQLPAPWSQVRRLGRHGYPQQYADPPGALFVARQTQRGEPVLILTTLGHRIAVKVGVDDVEPYTGALPILTDGQLADSVRALRSAGGRKLFVIPSYAWGSELRALGSEYGFVPSTQEPGYGIQMWVRR